MVSQPFRKYSEFLKILSYHKTLSHHTTKNEKLPDFFHGFRQLFSAFVGIVKRHFINLGNSVQKTFDISENFAYNFILREYA